MEEMPSLIKPVQRLKVATLPLDLPCCGLVTHSGEILTNGKSHEKKPDCRFLAVNFNHVVERRYKSSSYMWRHYFNYLTGQKGTFSLFSLVFLSGSRRKTEIELKFCQNGLISITFQFMKLVS